MEFWQISIVAILALISTGITVLAFQKAAAATFTETPYLSLLGIFVWGDAIIFAPFWLIVSLGVLYFQQWLLFLFIYSVFWVVRSLGETYYWFNEQFSGVTRNKPENLLGYSLVKSDAVWFLYQIFWQCVCVLAVVSAIYTGWRWLSSLS